MVGSCITLAADSVGGLAPPVPGRTAGAAVGSPPTVAGWLGLVVAAGANDGRFDPHARNRMSAWLGAQLGELPPGSGPPACWPDSVARYPRAGGGFLLGERVGVLTACGC